MKITLICNCGLVFSSGETCLLIDALTQELAPFYRAPESVRQEIVTGTGAYEKTCGLLFTHLHPDHYDKEAAQAFAQYHSRAALYVPNRRELPPERRSIGSFTVELHRVRHTQVAGYGKSTVDAMIISADGTGRYFFISRSAKRFAGSRRKISSIIFRVTRRTAFGGSWSGCAGAILQSWKPSACWEITHPKSSCNKECRPGKPGRHLKSYSAMDQLSPS